MKNHLSKMFILTVFSSVVLTGCNTVRGIGSDIASVGNGIVNTANKVSYTINYVNKRQPIRITATPNHKITTTITTKTTTLYQCQLTHSNG